MRFTASLEMTQNALSLSTTSPLANVRLNCLRILSSLPSLLRLFSFKSLGIALMVGISNLLDLLHVEDMLTALLGNVVMLTSFVMEGLMTRWHAAVPVTGLTKLTTADNKLSLLSANWSCNKGNYYSLVVFCVALLFYWHRYRLITTVVLTFADNRSFCFLSNTAFVPRLRGLQLPMVR